MPTSFTAVGKSCVSPRYHSKLPARSRQARSFDEKKAKIRLPSLAGVLAATELVGWHIVRPVAQNCRSQSTAPVLASMHTTCNRSWLKPLAEVTITLPATRIGLETPRPGRAVFQATLCSMPASSLARSTGGAALVATERLSEPRKCSQSAPAVSVTHSSGSNSLQRRVHADPYFAVRSLIGQQSSGRSRRPGLCDKMAVPDASQTRSLKSQSCAQLSFLVVLQHLHQDDVPPGFHLALADVLIHLLAGVIDIVLPTNSPLSQILLAFVDVQPDLDVASASSAMNSAAA